MGRVAPVAKLARRAAILRLFAHFALNQRRTMSRTYSPTETVRLSFCDANSALALSASICSGKKRIVKPVIFAPSGFFLAAMHEKHITKGGYNQ
jgi:hypothetical protein